MRRKINLILFLLIAFILTPSGIARATSIWPLSVELSAAPGETTTGAIRLTNNGEMPESYFLSVRDFSANADETGTPVFAKGDGIREHSMAPWISFTDEAMILTAGESREVNFTIQVPLDAWPGGYYTALLFGTNDTTNNVSVNTEVGALVFLNVPGDAKTEGSLASFDAPAVVSHLPEVFATRVQNSGQTTLVPTGSIVVTNMIGAENAQLTLNPDNARVLEGSTRRFETTWQKTEVPNETSEIVREWKNFGFGYYRATLALQIGEGQTINAQTAFWVIPWQLILTAVILILIISLLAKRAYKGRR